MGARTFFWYLVSLARTIRKLPACADYQRPFRSVPFLAQSQIQIASNGVAFRAPPRRRPLPPPRPGAAVAHGWSPTPRAGAAPWRPSPPARPGATVARGSSPSSWAGAAPAWESSPPDRPRAAPARGSEEPPPAPARPPVPAPPRRRGGRSGPHQRPPRHLLREILVRVRCARDAARTSILSRRWRGLWVHLRELSFRRVKPDAALAALAQVSSSDLTRLDISVNPNSYCSDACVTSLLRTAARFAPVHLTFSVTVKSVISLEVPNLQRAESISLQFSSIPYHCQLATADSFPMLERLSISGCHFNFTDLIARCPRLYALKVGISHYPFEIKVHSATIRELILDVTRLRKGINIEAPVLESLSLSRSTCSACDDIKDGMQLSKGINIDAPMLERLSLSQCDLILLFPHLRSLQLHRPVNSISLWMSKCLTMIEEIVLDDVDIIGGIYINAPRLKILTLNKTSIKYNVHIVAPVLKTFTLTCYMVKDVELSFSAPAVENLLWHFTYYQPDGGFPYNWFCKGLDLWREEGIYVLSLPIYVKHLGPDPPELHEMFTLPIISVLKLTLFTNGHAYETTVSHILTICCEIQRLRLIIKRDPVGFEGCGPKCSCGESESWRGQDISLSALEVVEIEGFGGKCCEVDFLKLLFRCASLMKQVTLKPCSDMPPSYRAHKEMYNLFKAHPSVKCYIYDSCGKKVVYGMSEYASRCR